jgi:hypothetical protein
MVEGMNLEKVKALLTQVSLISNNFENIARISGENFNIFKTLKLESSEVRMHSAFLAEFLNPKGTHGQGDLYLRLFIEQYIDQNEEKNRFDTKSAYAEVEKNIGPISDDHSKGGRIDILITDENGNHIIIENKIHAKDQKLQLLRYDNYDKESILFYLCLFEKEPTDLSTGGQLDKERYKVISYHTDILKWLDRSRKESASLPIIRETLTQYANLIKHLTNQVTKDKMQDEIKKLIVNNPGYANSIDICQAALADIIREIKEKFNSLMNKMFTSSNISLDNGLCIENYWGEDGQGVYFAYSVIENEKNISNSDKARRYTEILKRLDDKINSNQHHIGWFFPEHFQEYHKFEDFNKEQVIKYYNNSDELEKLVKDLIDEEKKIRAGLLDAIKKE